MPGHIVIGYIHPDFVRAEFMRSMLQSVKRCQTPIDAIIALKSGPLIASARNDLVSVFLSDHKADWLLMVDTDMVWEPEALDKLVRTAEEGSLPILGGLCFTERKEDGEHLATMYELVADEQRNPQFVNYTTWPEDQPFPVAGTGAAFLLVHRRAYQQIATAWGDVSGEGQDRTWPWFRESTMNGRRVGEDLTFCLRASVKGVPVHVHTGVQVGHMKSAMIGKVA